MGFETLKDQMTARRGPDIARLCVCQPRMGTSLLGVLDIGAHSDGADGGNRRAGTRSDAGLLSAEGARGTGLGTAHDDYGCPSHNIMQAANQRT